VGRHTRSMMMSFNGGRGDVLQVSSSHGALSPTDVARHCSRASLPPSAAEPRQVRGPWTPNYDPRQSEERRLRIPRRQKILS